MVIFARRIGGRDDGVGGEPSGTEDAAAATVSGGVKELSKCLSR